MPEAFADLLGKSTKTAFKLEFHDQYMVDDPAYHAWRAGDLDRAVGEYAGWTATARDAVERGIQLKRVRVVSEPVSEYIAFEHAVTSRVNVAAGEHVRWVSRHRVSDLAMPGNDVWIFDDSVLQFCLFDSDGRFVSNNLSIDPVVLRLCVSAFEGAWERGVDHDRYRLRS